MSRPRDPDDLIRAFLDEGPVVVSDRVLDVVRGAAHETPRRARFGPWRNLTMPRTYLAAAVVTAALAVGGIAIWATRQPSTPNVGGESTPSASVDARPLGELTVGETYRADTFGEPFRFVLPDLLGSGPATGARMDSGLFRLVGGGTINIFDDILITRDLCDPGGQIDLPSTTEGISDWLISARDASLLPMTISEPTEITVDGRAAVYYDVVCTEPAPPAVQEQLQFYPNEPHRMYAIPTSDDAILLITYEGDAAFDAFNEAVNELVSSMTFD